MDADAAAAGLPGAGAPLHIALTVDPEIPVPPAQYGGIERIVDMVVAELVRRGHHVTLFANPKSTAACELNPYPALRSQAPADVLRNTGFVSSRILRGHFDVVHSFARLAYLLPLLPASIPKIMSYQRPVTRYAVVFGRLLSGGTLHFTACARHLVGGFAGRDFHVIYNGVPLGKYGFAEQVAADAPLVFLGRVEQIKGTHLAIEVARASGRALVIAGNLPPGDHHRRYFDERVAPHIDGRAVQYVGPVDDLRKNDLLGRAAALLMPILWEEPFGIVMAEALACGTPVIGLRRGSVPEVVEDGVTGFVCDTAAQMTAAVARLDRIRRAACRRSAEERFSDRVITDQYERLYRAMVARR